MNIETKLRVIENRKSRLVNELKIDLKRGELLKEFLLSLPHDTELPEHWGDIDLTFNVSSKEALHDIRETMRKILGFWEDELDSVNAEGGAEGNGFALYTPSRNVIEKYPFTVRWRLRFVFSIAETPKEFTEHGCKWEPHLSTYLNFVCPVKQE